MMKGFVSKRERVMKTSDIIREFRDIKEDYKFDADIMSPEDERIARIKEIINNKLSTIDKTIFLLYVDCLSYRKLGERFGVSHMTCRKEVLRIKSIILKEYEYLEEKK